MKKLKYQNYNKSYYALNISLILIFIILIFNSYKMSQHNTHLQELAARSQFQSRIALKTSVSLANCSALLAQYLSDRDPGKIYLAEEKLQSAFANFNALLSYQALLNSSYSSNQYQPQIEELFIQFEDLLENEKLLGRKKDLILKMIDSTERLSFEFLNEESSIWFKESQNLREYARLKNSSSFLFYSLTLGFIIAQLLMVYYSVLRSRLIKRINLQNEQIIQQTRLSTVGLMSAELAHEINSPLMVIDGRLKIIETAYNKESPENEKITKNIEIIKRNSNRIHAIIKSFKTMVNNGENDAIEYFSINLLFDDVKEIVQARSVIKKVGLRFNKVANAPVLYANRVQIVQTITNVVSNAIDAVKDLHEKWVDVDYEIDIENEMIKILVTDSGRGIDEELQVKIFQSFYSTKSSAEGTGLGLSISKKIANEHGGDLFYNSESENTQFILALPYKKA